jgi:hypothetical protein
MPLYRCSFSHHRKILCREGARVEISETVVRGCKRVARSPLAILDAFMRNESPEHSGIVKRWGTVLFGVALLMFAAQANSQITGTGSIQGTVSDSSGTVVPNASVVLTEASTHVMLTSKSGSSDDYAFIPFLLGYGHFSDKRRCAAAGLAPEMWFRSQPLLSSAVKRSVSEPLASRVAEPNRSK